MYIDEDHEELDIKKRRTNNKKKYLNDSDQSIPSFEKFCKLNYVFIPPKHKMKEVEAGTEGEIIKFINDTIYEKKVREKLLKIYESYYNKFERICEDVISSKYQQIYENIYNFLIFLKFCKESFIRTILLNTDQNANDFFQSMENYFDRASGVKRKIKKRDLNEAEEQVEEVEENKMIFFLTESRFKDMKSLYKFLEICDNNLIWMEEDKPVEKKMRLLIIREIHKIDHINFNIFITRILEYHQDPYSQYYYVLIFDVSYDPRGLFEKIKPNNLCKMVFNNIENVSSKNIYKEILYKFTYEESQSLFMPNPFYTKKIVDYVNNHQISIKSFKNYFKFIIIDFFLLNSWKRDEYLIYSENLESYLKNGVIEASKNIGKKKDKQSKKNSNKPLEDDQNYKKFLEKFFWNELNEIYHSYEKINKNSSDVNNESQLHKYPSINFKKADVEHLIKQYHERRRVIDIFLHFYDFFEKLTEEISNNNKEIFLNPQESQDKVEKFDRYQFFFDFVQFGADPDVATSNRLFIIQKTFDQTVDYLELIKKIADKLELHLQNLDESCTAPREMLKELLKIKNEKGARVKYQNDNKKQKDNRNEHYDDYLPLLDRDEYKRRLIGWLNNFLKMEEFILLFQDFNKSIHSLINEKRPLISAHSKYVVFHEIVNPSLSTIIIETIQMADFTNHSKNSRNKHSELEMAVDDRVDYTKCNQFILLKQFLVLFSQASSEFKLKLLFIEFLNQLLVDKEDKEGVTRIKHYFLYFCHIFYLLGLITRKRTKDDIYLKNYYQMTNYFVRR